MGTFYTGLHAKCPERKLVSTAVMGIGASPAYVTNPKNGWVSVFPEQTESQDEKILEELSIKLSEHLHTGVIGFLVHDSDVFIYKLAADGKLLDSYNSSPGYFDGNEAAPEGGNLDALLQFCPDGTNREELERVLSSGGADIPNESFVMKRSARSGVDLLEREIMRAAPWWLKPVAFAGSKIVSGAVKSSIKKSEIKEELAANQKATTEGDPEVPGTLEGSDNPACIDSEVDESLTRMPEGFDGALFLGDRAAQALAAYLGLDHSHAISCFTHIEEGESMLKGRELSRV